MTKKYMTKEQLDSLVKLIKLSPMANRKARKANMKALKKSVPIYNQAPSKLDTIACNKWDKSITNGSNGIRLTKVNTKPIPISGEQNYNELNTARPFVVNCITIRTTK